MHYDFFDPIAVTPITIIYYIKSRIPIIYAATVARAPRFLTFSSISRPCAGRSTNRYLRVLLLYVYLYLPITIMCTSNAHLHVARTANTTRSAIDDTISGVPLWVHTYGSGGGGDTITRFSVVPIVSLGRITRARYALYIIYVWIIPSVGIVYIRNAKKNIFIFTIHNNTQRGEKP